MQPLVAHHTLIVLRKKNVVKRRAGCCAKSGQRRLPLGVNPRMKLVAFTTILLVGKLSGRACPPEELLYFCQRIMLGFTHFSHPREILCEKNSAFECSADGDNATQRLLSSLENLCENRTCRSDGSKAPYRPMQDNAEKSYEGSWTLSVCLLEDLGREVFLVIE